MTLEKSHVFVGIVSAVVSVVASIIVYAVALGEMRSDVRQLKERLSAIESLTKMASKAEFTRASVCKDIHDKLADAYTSSMRTGVAHLEDKLEKLECYRFPTEPRSDSAVQRQGSE